MKVVLVRGANKGIGCETAKQLAQLGHFVYILYFPSCIMRTERRNQPLQTLSRQTEI